MSRISSIRFVLLLALLHAGFNLAAQSLSVQPFPRYAIGIGIHTGLYPIHYDRGGGEQLTYFRPELRLYYQLHSRLSLQVGGFISHEQTLNDDSSVDSTGTVIGRYQGSNEHNDVIIHLLGRYSLTKRPHRVGFDAFFGFSYLYAHQHNTGAYNDYQSGVVTPYNLDRRAHNFLLTFGPSIRCSLGKHFELTGDYLFHNPIGHGNQLIRDNISSFNGPALGLRYRFHYR